MNKIFFLLILIILALGLPFIFNINSVLENFSLNQFSGDYPSAQTQVLLQDTYPTIGKNQISNKTANDIWREYPVFEVGSYEQITNNIRYPDNPDDGRCTPASMCNALYYNKKMGNNVITQLPPVNTDSGTRVGYFVTDERIITSLPYRVDNQNVLY